MSLKDILVSLDDPETSAAALQAAVALAKSHGAYLSGVHAYNFDLPLMMVSGGYIDPKTLDRFLDDGRRSAEEKSKALQASFTKALTEAGVEGSWAAVEGDVAGVLTQRAAYADLIIFGRPPKDEAAMVELTETVMFSCGRPVLLVPPIWPAGTLGQRVLIGWNGTREATRAVADALPLLARADAVHVLSIASEQELATSQNQVEAVATHLSRHGVRVSASAVVAGGLEAQDVLLNTAADRGADLLVIGGYGRGRLREMVLGGVTRTLFRNAAMPVLFSH